MLSITPQTVSPFTLHSIKETAAIVSAEEIHRASENSPYHVLSDGLQFPNEDQRFWWGVVAPTIQELMRKSEYDIAHQYQHLIFIYRYILPPSRMVGPTGTLS
jgi:Tryptophan dimethylallyltransferase.